MRTLVFLISSLKMISIEQRIRRPTATVAYAIATTLPDLDLAHAALLVIMSRG